MSAFAGNQLDLGELGIADPLAFCRRAVQKGLRNLGTTHLEPDDLEEAHSFLLVELCKLAQRYDRSKARGQSFSTWSFRRLTTFGIISWYREHFGDSRYGEWLGGSRGCRHVGDTEDRCECGAMFVRNGGREQARGDAGDFVSGATLDPEQVKQLIEELDGPMLSQRARGTLNQVFLVMAEQGLKPHEAAARLGKSRRDLNGDLHRTREELRCLYQR